MIARKKLLHFDSNVKDLMHNGDESWPPSGARALPEIAEFYGRRLPMY
jgi:hypothetical protein